MPSAKNSIKNGIEGISELIDQIKMYAIEDVPPTKRRSAKIRAEKNIIENLDEGFWLTIRDEISRMLVANLNAIRIMNKPEYAEWKRRARINGYNVQVFKDGTKETVKFIRGGFLTGTLRDKVSEVEVAQRKKNTRSRRPDSIEYTIDFSDLRNDYNEHFEKFVKENGYDDIFALTEQQMDYILERIASRVSVNL